MYKQVDRSEPILCVFIDLAKAFDTVSHKYLLEALDDIGVRGMVLELFKSYLSNRPQAVKIGEKYSEEIEINYGIPQGIVLGPLLFSIYINELLILKTEGKTVSFANDTAILYTSKTWEIVKEKKILKKC